MKTAGRTFARLSFPKAVARLLLVFIAPFVFIVAAAAQNPVPLVDQPLVPDATAPGGAGFVLTVDGAGFVPGSVVKWNGAARATTFVSKSQLKANILASDIATLRTASVTVVSPGPGGGTSTVAYFEVTVPRKSIVLNVSEFGIGKTAYPVAAADFNGDGKLDLVVGEFNGKNVIVLLGNGNGTFRPQVSYAVGVGPISVVVGDFNRDGKLDLAVLNSDQLTGSSSVSILMGNGDGTFRAAVNYPVGSGGALSIAAGDLDGDGNLDLVVANPRVGVNVLLGDGDGTFRAGADYDNLPVGPTGVAVGDFNRDGKLDLAVALGSPDGTGSAVGVMLGNGDGTFRAPVSYATGKGPFGVVTADFNGDGKLDLAVANTYGNSMSVLLGNGDGSFRAHVDYGAGQSPFALGFADLNGDGLLDLIAANQVSGDVSVYFGIGDGTFQKAVQYHVGSIPESVAVGDFNRGGRLDIAVPNYFSGAATVLLQVPTISLSKASLTFVDQLLGTASASQTVTLMNTGGVPLTVSSIVIAGTNANEFSQTNNCGSSLLPAAHCTTSVIFKPTQAGPHTASVTITDNAPTSPQSITLSGTGVASGPNATLMPTSLTFATQLVATASPNQSVMLSNRGTKLLAITSIRFGGNDPTDFSQTNNCGSALLPGVSCTLSVHFYARQRGLRTATLKIADNAPGNLQTVALSGTGTVVKLFRSSMSFNCHTSPTRTCPPPPQTSTLTNTGSTALTINSIAITGKYFSETNTCRSTLGPGGSCLITIHFNPTTWTTVAGAVSANDNGGGSPQQIALRGTETKKAMTLAAVSALRATQSAAVPKPTGPSSVGSRVVHFVDQTRSDPFVANGDKRELLVRFWYPASDSQSCAPAPYTSAAVWGYFSQLLGFQLPEVRTNSCLDAPVSAGPHPVVVFTPGYTGTFTDYTFLFEELASRGYVVAVVDHTYEATAVEFPDGRLVKSVFGSHLAPGTWRRDEQSLSIAVSVRLNDLKFIADELKRLDDDSTGPFAGRLDMNEVAIAGHSLGGLVALRSLKEEHRFKTAILLDASMVDTSATETPVLFMGMGRETWNDDECQLWSALHGRRFAVNFNGAEHVTPTDAVWLAEGGVKTGTMGTERTEAAIRDYITAFLDANLRGFAPTPLLTAPPSQYPDAVVTTQKQPLCRKP